MMSSIDDRPPSDPTLLALGAYEHQEADRVAKIEAAVDSGDAAALEKLLGCTPEAAKEMIVRLSPPDLATREQWLDRWEGARKTRRLMPRIAAVSASVAAAAAAGFLFFIPDSAPMFAFSGAEIVSAPAHHLSGGGPAQPIEPTADRHRDVAGDLLRVTVTSAQPHNDALEATACWKVGEKIETWTVPSAVERDDELHSTIGVKIPDDALGEGRLILVLARKGDLPRAQKAREECAKPTPGSPWSVVTISPPILVEPNISRKENLSP